MSTFSLALKKEAYSHEMPFEVCNLEWAIQNRPEYLFSPHKQKQFEIIWIKKGSGSHVVNQEIYSLNGNTIYAALPGQKHQLHLDPKAKGYIITFNSSWFHKVDADYKMFDESFLYFFFSQSPALALDDELAGGVHEVIFQLDKETSNFFLLKTEIISRYLQILQLYLRRQLEKTQMATAPVKNSLLLKKYLSLLENNFKEKKTVADYAKELNMSSNYLNQVIKKASGYSAGYHIRQRIVLEAKRKAKHSGASMKEIAYYLGFDDIAHFSKFFKTVSGINFSDFKKSCLAEFSL